MEKLWYKKKSLLHGSGLFALSNIKKGEQVIEYIGAKPYFMDPQEHDSYVGAVSHLPMMLSKALILSTSQSPSWREIAKLAASGYRDISRLAS